MSTPADLRHALASLQGRRRGKYGNVRTTVEGYRFDSAKEARRWTELRLLERAGEITGLRRQTRFPLVVNGQRVCEYVSDFDYYEAGEGIVEDCKGGVRTPVYRLKKKLMQACHGIEIKET